jgi:hypothetical protein
VALSGARLSSTVLKLSSDFRIGDGAAHDVLSVNQAIGKGRWFMTNYWKALAVTVLSTMVMGCFVAPVAPPRGLIYTNIGSAIDTTAGGKPVAEHRGTATSKSILGLVAWGDSGVNRAALNGGLDRIQQIDYEFYNILLVYQRMTVVVYGDKDE